MALFSTHRQHLPVVTDSVHFISEGERKEYVDFINGTLGTDNDNLVGHFFPIDSDSADIFDAIAESLLIPKIIARWFPNIVDFAKYTTKREKSTFEKNINHDLAIDAAKQIGAVIVNIGGNDLTEKKETLCLGLLWQLIKIALFAEIERTLDATLSNLPPEQLLFRWFNYHLKNYGTDRTVRNWSSDLQDAECYTMLLSEIAGDEIGQNNIGVALRESEKIKRAQMVVEFAEIIKCRKFITAKAIVEGNPRLNLAFVATLYLAYPDMGPSPEELRAKQLERELEEMREQLRRVTRERDETEALMQEQKQRYEDEIERLKRRIRELEEEVERLKRLLEEERKINADLRHQLSETQSELEAERALHNEKLERKRRKQKEMKKTFEEIIMALRQEKEDALSSAQREMLEALDRERLEGKQTLVNVEMENIKQYDKIRNILVGSQKVGILKKQGRGIRIGTWKNRFFVLKENILCYYKSRSEAENFKPLGVIYLDQARIYELPEKEKKFAFQVATPTKSYAMQAKDANEMKEWMIEIKMAKKRSLGVEAIGKKGSLPTGRSTITTTKTTTTTTSPLPSPRPNMPGNGSSEGSPPGTPVESPTTPRPVGDSGDGGDGETTPRREVFGSRASRQL